MNVSVMELVTIDYNIRISRKGLGPIPIALSYFCEIDSSFTSGV